MSVIAVEFPRTDPNADGRGDVEPARDPSGCWELRVGGRPSVGRTPKGWSVVLVGRDCVGVGRGETGRLVWLLADLSQIQVVVVSDVDKGGGEVVRQMVRQHGCCTAVVIAGRRIMVRRRSAPAGDSARPDGSGATEGPDGGLWATSSSPMHREGNP